MTHIVVGESASGKTLWLRNYIDTVGHNKCNSNLDGLNNVRFNRNRLDVLGDLIESDIRVLGGSFIAPDTNDYRLSRRFFDLAAIICNDLDYLALDEPEQLLTITENIKIVQLLCRLSIKGLYKEMTIVTKEAAYFAIPNSKYYTVKMSDNNKVDRIEITEEDTYEFT